MSIHPGKYVMSLYLGYDSHQSAARTI